MTSLAFENKYKGGFCYAACQELFTFYNPSTLHCRKGCDFAMGRVDDPVERETAMKMCKRYATEVFITPEGALDNLEDLRVHGEMYPNTSENVYKVCLSGIRRQPH